MGLKARIKKNHAWIKLSMNGKDLGVIKVSKIYDNDKALYIDLELDESIKIERLYSDETKNLYYRMMKHEGDK